VQFQIPAIRFKSGTPLRQNRKNCSVRRKERSIVRGGIRSDFFDVAACYGDRPHVAVGVQHFPVASVAIGNKYDRTAVRAEGDCSVFVEMRRRIEITGRDVACFSALDFRNEHMVPDADTPFVPMAEGKTGQYAKFYRILFGRFTRTAIALFILTLRLNIGDKRDSHNSVRYEE